MLSRQPRRRGKWLIFLLFLLALVATHRFSPYVAQTRETTAQRAEKSVTSLPPVDLASLAEKATLPPELSPEALAEEARVEAELVAEAVGWLNDRDPNKRLEGAQQLGAYATVEAQAALAKALLADPDTNVRIAAADSLSQFKTPSEETWTALLRAVRDKAQDVQLAALTTLQLLAAHTNDQKLLERVRKSLHKQATSRRASLQVRETILAILEELQP